MKSKIDYYFQDDILTGRPKEREYASSSQIGNFIFDIDKEGHVAGVEILNASKLLNIPKAFIKNFERIRINITATKKFILMTITVVSNVRNSHKTSTLTIERITPQFLNPSELEMAVV